MMGRQENLEGNGVTYLVYGRGRAVSTVRVSDSLVLVNIWQSRPHRPWVVIDGGEIGE